VAVRILDCSPLKKHPSPAAGFSQSEAVFAAGPFLLNVLRFGIADAAVIRP
jgi:hypothetical protein